MRSKEWIKADAAFLSFEKIFQFTCGAQVGLGGADPDQFPRPTITSPRAHPGIMIVEPSSNVIGDSDIATVRRIFYEVNAIRHEAQKTRWAWADRV